MDALINTKLALNSKCQELEHAISQSTSHIERKRLRQNVRGIRFVMGALTFRMDSAVSPTEALSFTVEDLHESMKTALHEYFAEGIEIGREIVIYEYKRIA